MPKLILLLSLALCANLFAQSTPARTDSLEGVLTGLQYQTKYLAVERGKLDSELSAKSSAIEKLQANSNRNYFEHQRLQELLKSSQELARKIQLIDEQSDVLERDDRLTVDKLIAAYESEIQAGMARLKQKTLDGKEKEAQLRRINKMRNRMNVLHATSNQLEVLNLKPVELTPRDTPKRIEQKADLVKDQEEKVRRFAKEIKTEKEKLNKELNLRTRISDLVTDLSLFDQQDEILTNLPDRGQSITGEESGFRNRADEILAPGADVQESGAGYEKDAVDGLFISQKNFDFSKLSEAELEEAIEMMQKQYLRVSSKADSLSQIAEKYYKTAKEQREEQQKKP